MILKKQHYSIEDWLRFHNLSQCLAQQYCCAIQGTYASMVPKGSPAQPSTDIKLDFQHSFKLLVLPAIQKCLCLSASHFKALTQTKIIKYNAGELETPFTVFDNDTQLPAVHLVWSDKPKDLITLSHEMAHAVQIILSENEFMPPLAREICAFMGELMLINFSQGQSHVLYQALCDIWHTQNQYYLHECSLALNNHLTYPSKQYNYWHNYPIARAIAISSFSNANIDTLKCVFSSGSSSINHFDFSSILSTWQGTHSNQANEAENASLQTCLSPVAWQLANECTIDPFWLGQVNLAECNIKAKTIEYPNSANPSQWIKWRSLGVFALSTIQQGRANVSPVIFIETYLKLASVAPTKTSLLMTPWIRPHGFDALAAMGMAIQLLSTSTYHSQFTLSDYLPIEIIPPLKFRQLQCFVGSDGEPLGMVSWAWLSKLTQKNVHQYGRVLQGTEWQSGKYLFFNDWVVDANIFRLVVSHIKNKVFPNEVASSLRRNADGSIRRINQWKSKKRLPQAK